MPTQALDLKVVNIKEWFSQFTCPVVVFAFSSWRRAEKCRLMEEFLNQLAQKPEYQNDVLFCFANLDDGHGEDFRSIKINDAPHVKIFLNGEEKGNFVDAGTGEGIITLLNILLDPSKRHHPDRGSFETVGQESPFCF